MLEEDLLQALRNQETLPKNQIAKINRQIFQEGQKSLNRIRMIRKSTAKIIRQQTKITQQMKKTEPEIISRMPSQKSLRKIKQSNQLYCKTSRCQSTAIQQKNREKLSQAQLRREDRQQNEKKIVKELQKAKRRNLKSAALIRTHKQSAIANKNAYFENRIKQIREQNMQKLARQKENCWLSYNKLRNLKINEIQTLKMWHKIQNQINNGNSDQNELYL